MKTSDPTPKSSPNTSPTSSKIRVGVIGCGAIGQRRHIPEAAANPHVELAALCDVNLERAKEVAAKHGVPTTYENYQDLIAKEPLDLIVVATPNALHARHAIAALEAGRHVLVEKPMAATLAEADAMNAAASNAGKHFMVGMNQRLMPPHVKAKKILGTEGNWGELGRPLNFQTSFKHPGPDNWSVDGPTSWFFHREMAVMGVCGDLGVHKIDLITYLLGQPITQIGGFIETLSKTYAPTDTNAGQLIDVDDAAFLTCRTSAGVIGTITISWTHYGQSEDNGTTIYCENGVMEIGIHPEYGVVVHHRDGTKSFHKTGAAATNQKQTSSGVIDSFVNALRNNRPPTITGQEGRRSLAVILGAFEAARSGKMVTVGN